MLSSWSFSEAYVSCGPQYQLKPKMDIIPSFQNIPDLTRIPVGTSASSLVVIVRACRNVSWHVQRCTDGIGYQSVMVPRCTWSSSFLHKTTHAESNLLREGLWITDQSGYYNVGQTPAALPLQSLDVKQAYTETCSSRTAGLTAAVCESRLV